MTTILCFSHLRWNFVYQRPQHLLVRCSRDYKIYFIEEPVYNNEEDGIFLVKAQENITVVKPTLNAKDFSDHKERQKKILDLLISELSIDKYICWYYAPMALQFSAHLKPLLTIYDCMDELSAFRHAPPELKETENNLLKKADLVFTGGYSLFNAKKHLHANIHAFPSSIEKEHFAKARIIKNDPPDQQNIPYPRLGFFGVLDERFDADLIKAVAEQKPEWHFVLIGPVVKIDSSVLPKASNIHYLGSKNYNELPSYISGWQIALVPFAINESTRFISPTKTPEYLAAGKPVISTAITDIIHPYGDEKLVSVIHNADEFINAATEELSKSNKESRLKKADAFLANISWDNTWNEMHALIKEAMKTKININKKNKEIYV